MARTESTMLKLGSPSPDFSLPDVETGEEISLDYFEGSQALLVMFICRHCPFVKHIEHELAAIGNDYADKSLGIVAISSNDAVNYPDDKPESLLEMKYQLGFKFPYCHDDSQKAAKSFTAACTPDFFLFDSKRDLAYRGRLDGSRPGNDEPVTGADLRTAIDQLLTDAKVTVDQLPSIGCNIKWKPGNEPDYF